MGFAELDFFQVSASRRAKTGGAVSQASCRYRNTYIADCVIHVWKASFLFSSAINAVICATLSCSAFVHVHWDVFGTVVVTSEVWCGSSPGLRQVR